MLNLIPTPTKADNAMSMTAPAGREMMILPLNKESIPISKGRETVVEAMLVPSERTAKVKVVATEAEALK